MMMMIIRCCSSNDTRRFHTWPSCVSPRFRMSSSACLHCLWWPHAVCFSFPVCVCGAACVLCHQIPGKTRCLRVWQEAGDFFFVLFFKKKSSERGCYFKPSPPPPAETDAEGCVKRSAEAEQGDPRIGVFVRRKCEAEVGETGHVFHPEHPLVSRCLCDSYFPLPGGWQPGSSQSHTLLRKMVSPRQCRSNPNCGPFFLKPPPLLSLRGSLFTHSVSVHIYKPLIERERESSGDQEKRRESDLLRWPLLVPAYPVWCGNFRS